MQDRSEPRRARQNTADRMKRISQIAGGFLFLHVRGTER